MKTSPVTIKDQFTGEGEEEEPPSPDARNGEAEEEPPGTGASSTRARFFANVPDESWNDWRWHLQNRITTIDELGKFIPMSAKERSRLKLTISKYPLSVTPHYLSLINVDDPNDPIRKQALPSFKEIAFAGTGLEDPLEEEKDSVVPGLVHRYPDRVLMVLTDVCPVLCRHCTRKREWRKGSWVRTPAEIEAMLEYIRSHQGIRDVVISGGDPLTLSTERLEVVLSQLRQIGHVEIVRIGSRYPVVLPQRIDDELCAMLSKYGPIWFNTHFNHPREITPDAAKACDKLLRAGVPVNNQSVLLRGVNDTVQTQMELCHGLLRIKVRPYYLFECDDVQGTEHLRTPIETGIDIIEGMRGHTSGLAVPTFVLDLPHGGGKVPLQPQYVQFQSEDELVLRNYKGDTFRYRNPKDMVTPRSKRRNGNGNVAATGAAKLPASPAYQPQLEGFENENRPVVRS